MRTAYLGTSPFAVTVLRRLAESDHRPALVVTPPDRRKGRGRKFGEAPAAEAGAELGIEVHKTPSVNEPASVEAIRAAAPEVLVVCAFGQLIKEPLLSGYEMLNVHPSLIPLWRGAAPIERSIMAGDDRTGVTILKLTEGLDSGPVALQEEVGVEPGEGFESLSGRLAELGGELMVRALDLRERGELELTEQDDDAATYAEKIEAADRRLDPGRPAEELWCAVRALNPHIGTHLETSAGDRLRVLEARPAEAQVPTGELAAGEGSLVLGCDPGSLELLVVQAPGGRPMPAEEFLRGHEPPSGFAGPA